MSFCALCTTDIPAGQEHHDNLGPGDALVVVCKLCDTSPPVWLEPVRRYRAPAAPRSRTRRVNRQRKATP